MADQAKIEKFLQIVEQKKEEIARATKPSYVTNLTYPITRNDSINLASITDVDVLVQLLSDLLMKNSFHLKAAVILNSSSEFKIGVNTLYTLNEWIEDIKTRMLVLNLRKNREILEKVEAELLKLESPEIKAQKKINEIENLLNNL